MKYKKEVYAPSVFSVPMKEEANIKKARRKFILFTIVILLIFAFSLLVHTGGFDHNIINKIEKNEISPSLFIAGYIAISFVPIPFTPTPFLGGFIFPLGYAFLYTLIATTIFSCIIFFIARYLGRDYIKYLIRNNSRLKRLDESTRKHGFVEFFFLRLFYLIPVEFTSVIGAFSEISFKDFFFATILGSAPVLFFSIMLVRAKLNGKMLFVALAILGLILLIIIPLLKMPYLKKYFKK